MSLSRPTLMLVLGLVSPPVFAQDICTDAVSYVCSGDQNTREAEVKKAAVQVRNEAAKQVIAFRGLKKQTPEAFIQNILMEFDPQMSGILSKLGKIDDEAVENVSLYVGCTDYLSRARFSGSKVLPQCFNPKLVGRGKGAVSAALNYLSREDVFSPAKQLFAEIKADVRHEIEKSTKVSITLKERLLNQLDATAHVSVLSFVTDIQNLVAAEDPTQNLREVFTALISACDLSIEDMNAFNYPKDQKPLIYTLRKINSMVVCPATWVRAGSATELEGQVEVFTVLAHELGHSLEGLIRNDALVNKTEQFPNNTLGSYNSPYTNVNQCMTSQYVRSGELSINYPEGVTSQIAREILGFSPEQYTANLFFPEYSADVISATALSEFIKKEPKIEARKISIKRSLDFFCGNTKHDEMRQGELENLSLHPSGTFRIKNGFMSTPELRQALGCRPTPAPTCKFL